jgi:Tfp pilus assembly protein PilX
MKQVLRHPSSEDGWVVVTAIALMAIMLGVGLAVLATADTQSSESRRERVRESAFNLAEGLMQAESVVLQNNWPIGPPCATNDFGCGYRWTSTDDNACTQLTATSAPNQCPDASRLVGNNGAFSNVDQSLSDTTWNVQVRDDLGVCLSNPPNGYSAFYNSCQIPTYYKGLCPPPNENDATKCWPATAPHTYATNPNEAPGVDQKLCTDSSGAAVVCTWDANGNDQLWVRISATANGKTRSMVALLHLEQFPVTLNSKDAVNGGAINFSNNGNKHIVDATGSQIVARCVPTDNFNGSPTTGKQLKTTMSDVTTGNTTATITIPANSDTAGFANLQKGTVLALGADSGVVPPYELLEVDSVGAESGGVRTIQFKSKVQFPHNAIDGSNIVELAPAATNANPTPNNCESWTSPLAPTQNGADKHQLDAPQNYKSDPNYPDFLDDATLPGIIAGLKHWTTCPTSWIGNIYIESLPAGTTCTIPNGTFNTSAKPHFIIVDGLSPTTCSVPALKLSGNTTYYGIIYMRNSQNCGFGQTIVEIAAGGQIQGGVAVDGLAKVDIGNASNSGNCAVTGGSGTDVYCPTIKFDPVAFGSIAASGAAGLVQNTWRELAPGQ